MSFSGSILLPLPLISPIILQSWISFCLASTLSLWMIKWFLISNDKVLTKQKDIQDHKIIGLIKVKGKGVDPKKVIFNFSSYVLSDNDKWLLFKDLNFSLPNKKVEI